eukprot:744274-Alexandrium_andersonii.AAC.1
MLEGSGNAASSVEGTCNRPRLERVALKATMRKNSGGRKAAAEGSSVRRWASDSDLSEKSKPSIKDASCAADTFP